MQDADEQAWSKFAVMTKMQQAFQVVLNHFKVNVSTKPDFVLSSRTKERTNMKLCSGSSSSLSEAAK